MEALSRTKRKKNAQALQKMGESLVYLDNAQFEALELPGELMEAVAMARQIKQKEARRRQLQYIGRLMRLYDPDIIATAIDSVSVKEAEKQRRFKMVERWRDELVAGDQDRFAWLVDNIPNIDAAHLKQLVDSATRVQTKEHPRKAGRMLFRYLSQLDIDQY